MRREADPRTILSAARRAADAILPIQRRCELAGVEPVGRYGMRLRWGDGHDTGIYTYDYLRELADAPEVRAEREP